MTNRSGQDLVLASLLAPRADSLDLVTPGICGPTGFGSYRSAALSALLVSRLQARVRGSILYRLTWKLAVTPSQRSIFRLRASSVRISASDFTGWPTPTTPSGGQTWPEGTSATGRRPDGSKATVNLEQIALLSGWATPKTPTGGPNSKRKERGAGGADIQEQAQLAAWATPSQRDYRTPNLGSFADRGGGKKGEQLSNQVIHQGPALTGSSAEIAAGARLNPAHPRWLLRLPPVWDACAVTAMPSTRKPRRSS